MSDISLGVYYAITKLKCCNSVHIVLLKIDSDIKSL